MKIQSVLIAAGFVAALAAPAFANPFTSPQQIAQATGCGDGESTFVITETQNYYVYICGGDYPYTYVGIDKYDPTQAIRLPLNDYDNQGNYYEAVSGDITYILSKTPRGSFLTVTQGYDELLREPTLSDW
jgi:hypothetical protein